MERKPFEERLRSIEQEAATWTPTWKDLRRYNQPTRGFFKGDLANNGKAIDHKTILDGTPQRAANNLASGLASHLTSPSRPWWRPTLTDIDLMEYEPVKYWLADVETKMYAVQAGSNIYPTLHADYEEIGTFATSAMALLEDREDTIRGRSYTIGEYFLGVGADGRVNTFGYRYQRTVGQLVQEYGKGRVSPKVRQLFSTNKVDERIDCCYIIMPNPARDPGKIDNRNMPFASAAWEEGSAKETFLDNSGFNEFPILASRWGVTGQNIYGNGAPGWNSLGDSKMLQKLQRDKLMGVEKVMDPPVQADESVSGNPVNTLPGGLTRTSSTNPNGGVRAAYQIQPDFRAIQEVIRETQEAIKEAHFEHLFLMISRDEKSGRTAREIVERSSEKLSMLGPLVERLYQEKLSPLIRRQFNIMWRANLLPPPPPELENQTINIELISILAQAQKAVGTRAIDEQLAVVGELSKTYPDVTDLMDSDEAVRSRHSMIGAPPKMLRSPEGVARLRADRAKAQQAQAQAAQAQAMVDGAKTLSETKLGQGSALDAIAGDGGAQ